MDTAIAVLFLLGLSTSLAFVLAVAHRRLRVQEDPRVDRVAEMLPGTNCGACGFPGCRAFAEATTAGKAPPSRCPVGGAETARAIGEYLGVDPGSAEKKVARLLCAGGTDVARQEARYRGFPSCRAAAAAGGGGKACPYGCLGLGDCEVACTFDAIEMNPAGLPVVDIDRCTGCEDCVKACPKGLFVMLPLRQRLLVQCRSQMAGEGVRSMCRVGCDACARCVADAPAGLLRMVDNLPVLDPARLEEESPAAVRRCPTGAIVWLAEGRQFASRARIEEPHVV